MYVVASMTLPFVNSTRNQLINSTKEKNSPQEQEISYFKENATASSATSQNQTLVPSPNNNQQKQLGNSSNVNNENIQNTLITTTPTPPVQTSQITPDYNTIKKLPHSLTDCNSLAIVYFHFALEYFIRCYDRKHPCFRRSI